MCLLLGLKRQNRIPAIKELVVMGRRGSRICKNVIVIIVLVECL